MIFLIINNLLWAECASATHEPVLQLISDYRLLVVYFLIGNDIFLFGKCSMQYTPFWGIRRRKLERYRKKWDMDERERNRCDELCLEIRRKWSEKGDERESGVGIFIPPPPLFICVVLIQVLFRVFVLILIIVFFQPGHFEGNTFDIVSAFQVCEIDVFWILSHLFVVCS